MLTLRIGLRRMTKCSKESSNILGITVSNTKTTQKSVQFITNDDTDIDDDYEKMYVKTQFNDIEWGGPLRGGKNHEPTRFGDWERKGRCTDY